MDTC